jgi:DNA polymerase-3 subunit delta'
MGRRRVAIIDDADWLNQESANSLLKMLEEPPPGAVVVLLGTSRNRQLPTILSRAQLVRFHPLSVETAQHIALAEGLAANEMAAAQLAHQSDGSIARMRELADPRLTVVRDKLIAAWQSGEWEVERLSHEVNELIAGAGTEADARRRQFRQLLALVGEALRGMLRSQSSSSPAAEATLAALDRCLQAEEQLDRNANQNTLVESLLVDLSGLAVERQEVTAM